MNKALRKHASSRSSVQATPGIRPVAAALAGIGFAALLVAPLPMAVAAGNEPPVLVREMAADPWRVASGVATDERFDADQVGITARRARPKAIVPLTVVNTLDVGGLATPFNQGSLRQMLEYANNNACYGPDTFDIQFAIPGPGPHTIATNIGYQVDCPLTHINGFTQAGASANTVPLARNGANANVQVVIDGSGMTGGPLFSFNTGSAGSSLRGLALRNWATASAAVTAATGPITIGGNYIGTDTSGNACTATAGASKVGIQAGFGDLVIGSALPADRNVIGCATGAGIALGGPNHVVKGNLIGVGADGATAIANGVGISAAFNNQTIGGSLAGEGNVIARNTGAGIGFGNFSAIVISGNDIFGNGLLGIDLGNDGPTPNNTNLFPGPAPSNGQNYPVITDVSYTATDTVITGTFHGFSNTTTGMEFFDNVPLLGMDEGARFVTKILQAVVTPPAPFTVNIPGVVRNPSATGITLTSGTSEFSPAFLTPDLAPSTNAINFGNVPVGGSSGVLPLSIQNSGLAPLLVDSIARSLTDYVDTTGGPPPNSGHWCGIGSDATGAPLPGPSTLSIPAGGNCNLNLIFTPQTSGARNATLVINDAQSPARSVLVNLQGNGSVTPLPVSWALAPTAILPSGVSNLQLTIGNPNLGPFINPTFTYNLPAGLVIAPTPNATNPVGPCAGGFTASAAGAPSFTIGGLQVPTGGSCSFSLNVTAAAPGNYAVSMPAGTIAGSVLAAAVANALSNTATLAVNAPAIAIAPPSFDFGSVTIATSVGPALITVTNTGGAPLVFSAPLTSTGDYAFLTTCSPGTPLAPAPGPGNSCSLDVTFTPTVAGVRAGSITIPSNAPGSPHTVALTGTGVATPVPVVGLVPTALNFAAQNVATTSAPQTVTLSNLGTAALNITSITTSGDFAQSSGCGPTLAPAASCPIAVTFTPIISGARTGDIRIVDNASGSPHIVTLNGTGVTPPVPTLTAPASVTFPPTQVGGVSTAVAVTVTNSGGGSLVVSAAQVIGGGFNVVSDTCTGATVPPAGTCVVTLAFAPTAAGATASTLRLVSNALSSPNNITLSGTGTAAPVGTLAATPAALTFGTQVIGATTAAQTVEIANAGAVPVTVSVVEASGDFGQSNNCAVVPAGGTCTLTVTFTPSLTGLRTGAVSLVSDASNSPLSVPLAGTGAPIPAPVIELSVSSLSFGNRLMGTSSALQPITLRNVGGAALILERIYAAGDFVQSNNCPPVVNPGASCRLDVGFAASVPGPRTGRIVILSNSQGAPHEAQLSGTGCRFFSLTGNRSSTLLCQ